MDLKETGRFSYGLGLATGTVSKLRHAISRINGESPWDNTQLEVIQKEMAQLEVLLHTLSDTWLGESDDSG